MQILIVDDSRAMRNIVTRALRQAGFDGHEIREADNGKTALTAIESSVPDLVLSDWNMPEMLGIDLLKKVREKGIGVPFFFVTSERNDAYRTEALKEGAAGIISKPFTADALKTELGGILK